MKTVVITGASSFIALSLIKKLKENYKIIAVIRKERRIKELEHDNISIVIEEMENYRVLNEKIQEGY